MTFFDSSKPNSPPRVIIQLFYRKTVSCVKFYVCASYYRLHLNMVWFSLSWSTEFYRRLRC